MPKGSPFFKILDDRGNPINKAMNQAADSGNHFGDSKSIDANGQKYPKGFTPPVDFYSDPKSNAEYGDSLIVDGAIIDSDGKLTKTDGNGKINEDNLAQPKSYIDEENKNGSLPVEYGNSINHDGLDPSNPTDKLKDRLTIYDNFKDFSSKEFTHLLDYFIDQNGDYTVPKTISTATQEGSDTIQPDTSRVYLGSFIRTVDDNEDPTILGYDIEIKYNDSPLFNGTAQSFIDKFSAVSEIKSRGSILDNFKKQLFRFLKTDSPISSDRPAFLNADGTKTYYLRNLTGLNNLVESVSSNEGKAFVDYGKDMIGLEFNEDVSQNIGYLASLYKLLSWSRMHGKSIMPENLLRFDVDITITEIRKFNRVIANSNDSVRVYADLISKYTYTLYECQFFFTSLPHGDSLDMSDAKALDKYEIKFNYKFSTMKFTKFYGPNEDEYTIDNSYIDVSKVKSKDTSNAAVVDGSIQTGQQTRDLIGYDEFPRTAQGGSTQGNTIDDKKSEDAAKNSPSKSIPNAAVDKVKKQTLGKNLPFDKLKKDLKNAVVNELNRQILTQAALLNKTLNNIRDSIPFAGKMSEPRNIYSGNQNPFQNDIVNAARNFVGNSLKGFFTKP
jgi:hypothetical protein